MIDFLIENEIFFSNESCDFEELLQLQSPSFIDIIEARFFLNTILAISSKTHL